MSLIAVIALVGCTEPEANQKPGDGNNSPPPTDTEPPPPPTDTTPPPGGGSIVINEVMSDNESSLQLPSDALPDWIELYNTSDEPVDLTRVRLADESGIVWEGQEGTIPAGGFYVLYADEGSSTDHLPFSISSSGEELKLSLDGQVVDVVEVPELYSDVSFARFPDGSSNWDGTIWVTPDGPNGDTPSESLDARDTVFTNTVVHQIYFELTQAQYNQLNSGEEWATTDLTFDDIHYPEIRTRLKGSASYDDLSGKPQFKLDINDVDPEARVRGLKRFNLHNGNVMDPTRTRDYLSYQLARDSGLMAPRVGWAELFINGDYYGIYMVIEGYDDNLIEKHFPGQGDLGALFEPNESQDGGWGWGDFCSGDIAFDYEEGPVPVDPLVLEALNNASAVCGGAATDDRVADLWNYVDKDAFLSYMAWESNVNHTDGYKAPNNWRVYVDTSYKVHLVPSGAEWTWDFTPTYDSFGGQLASWCMQNNGCKRDMAIRALELADRVEELDLYSQFEDLTMWLNPIIQQDPRSPHSPATVSGARQSTAHKLQRNPGTIRSQVCGDFPNLQAYGCP